MNTIAVIDAFDSAHHSTAQHSTRSTAQRSADAFNGAAFDSTQRATVHTCRVERTNNTRCVRRTCLVNWNPSMMYRRARRREADVVQYNYIGM